MEEHYKELELLIEDIRAVQLKNIVSVIQCES
jgi:hypothetical protein